MSDIKEACNPPCEAQIKTNLAQQIRLFDDSSRSIVPAISNVHDVRRDAVIQVNAALPVVLWGLSLPNKYTPWLLAW